MCAAIVAGWIALATLVFSLNEGWPLAQSLFYAVDTGMSIGFGAVAEERTSTKLFTICHVLLGASAVGGAIALFAESVVADSSSIAVAEYSGAAMRAAFRRADADRSGTLSPAEFTLVLRGLGVDLPADELELQLRAFDENGDGQLTTEEFVAAVTPFLSDGSSVEEGIVRAVTRRGESALVRLARSARSSLLQHRVLVLWAAWIGAGAAWAAAVEGWDAVTALYFAVGGLATGGLQSPSLHPATGQLPDGSALFVAAYCLTGIPIFGMALGKFAGAFVSKMLAAKERKALHTPISPDEYEFAQQLFNSDGKVDLAEFMALELLRLGKVDVDMLRMIRAQFMRLDADRNGKLSREEVCREVCKAE